MKQRRAMTDAQLAAVDDGRVFTGRQGIGLHLVDRLGGEREAIAWLEQEKSVPKGLKMRDWKPPRAVERLGLFSLAARRGGVFSPRRSERAARARRPGGAGASCLTVLSRFGKLTAQIDFKV